MYELEYVKKRKRRKIALIIGGVSTVGISTLSIVSFLGRRVGNFTVKLDTGEVQLALSREHTFYEPTSYLKVDDMPNFYETSYEYITDVIGSDRVDNESTKYNEIAVAGLNADGSIKGISFFKYTFFVKNVGYVNAGYTFALKVLESINSYDGRSILDTLRVMIYENDDNSDTHAVRDIYAKNAEYENEFASYVCKDFTSESVVASFRVDGFKVKEMKRYTIAYWLEGTDQDSKGNAPEGASLRLGVEINAYEN